MTEDNVVRIVRAYLEGLFPRACPACGRRYGSLREYLNATTHLSQPVLYDDIAGEIPVKPLGPMSLANCPCGTTVSIGSRGIPAPMMVELLTWAKQESVARGISVAELLSHIRDRIDAEVMASRDPGPYAVMEMGPLGPERARIRGPADARSISGRGSMLSNILSRYWWVTLCRGILWILFGLVVLARPGASLMTLTLLFGTFAIADGMAIVASAVGGWEHENWWILMLVGLSGLLVGALTFINPGTAALMLLFLIALWAISTGVLEILAAVQLRDEVEGEMWLGLAGFVSVAFGVFLAAWPDEGARAILWVVACYAVILGSILVALAFETRAFAERLTRA